MIFFECVLLHSFTSQAASVFRGVSESEENHALGHLEFLQVIHAYTWWCMMHPCEYIQYTRRHTCIQTCSFAHYTHAYTDPHIHMLACNTRTCFPSRSPTRPLFFLTNTRTKKRSCARAIESDGPPSLVYHLIICNGLCARVYTCECIHARTHAHTHTHKQLHTNTTIHKCKYNI